MSFNTDKSVALRLHPRQAKDNNDQYQLSGEPLRSENHKRDLMPFEFRSTVRQRCALSPTLFNHIFDWILGQARRRLGLTSIPALLVQRRLRWFGHAARRAGGELIKDLLLPTPPRTQRT